MLDGIRIIEFEGLGPGPFAAMTLADLGADVIVVHRETPPLPGMPERSLLDRGKRSIVVDLKNDNQLRRLKTLLRTADALIEGLRPGVMERLGLGPDDVRRLNPRTVYGRVTGWGQDGPKASEAGHDLNYIALSGALWYSSPPGAPPFTPPTLVGDVAGGAMYLVAGILAALLRAQRTGKGSVVDAAIVDGSAHMMSLLLSGQSAGMLNAERGRSMLDGPHWSRCYAAGDGGWLSVQCVEPKFYAEFLEKLGLADDAAFLHQHDAARWPELSLRLAKLFAENPLEHWTRLFENSDACVAAVLSPAESAAHPHMAARKTWTSANGELQARAAPRFDGQVPPQPPGPPARGEHTEEILGPLS